MKSVEIINEGNGAVISDRTLIADNFLTRLKGLLGKREMQAGEGLVIYPCSMVHCLGMKIWIDVLFISADNKIVHIIENMKPGQISPWIKNARYVIELPAGQVARTNTQAGDEIEIISTSGSNTG